MALRPKQPVVICPRCRRRMVTKEYRPLGPKARKAIKFTDSLIEVAYAAARRSSARSERSKALGRDCYVTRSSPPRFGRAFFTCSALACGSRALLQDVLEKEAHHLATSVRPSWLGV